MSKIDYSLECSPCKFKFKPAEIRKLRSVDEKYKYQVFMDGVCPACKNDVLGFLGIGEKGKLVNYYPISLKHASKWYDRLDTDLIREKAVKIDPEKHTRVRSKTVKGFKKEINSGKWMPQIQAVR